MDEELRDKVFKAMISYGITEAIVDFDGGGDDGQVQEISVKGLTEEIEKIPLRDEHKGLVDTARWRSGDNPTLYDFIEGVAYVALEMTGEDWVNNDGGWGNVFIEPYNRKLNVEMNLRFTSSTLHEYDYGAATPFDDDTLGVKNG